MDITKYKVKSEMQEVTVCFTKVCQSYAQNDDVLKAIESALKIASTENQGKQIKGIGNGVTH